MRENNERMLYSNGLFEIFFEKNHLGSEMAELLWWDEGIDGVWWVTLFNTTKFRIGNLHS
jgi:hypothetical protein